MSKTKPRSRYDKTPFLKEVTPLSEVFGKRPIALLTKLYGHQNAVERTSATILNAIYTQNRAYFFIGQRTVGDLIKYDTNSETNTINGERYKNVISSLLSYCMDEVKIGEDFLSDFKLKSSIASGLENRIPRVYRLNKRGRRELLGYGWNEKEQKEEIISFLRKVDDLVFLKQDIPSDINGVADCSNLSDDDIIDLVKIESRNEEKAVWESKIDPIRTKDGRVVDLAVQDNKLIVTLPNQADFTFYNPQIDKDLMALREKYLKLVKDKVYNQGKAQSFETTAEALAEDIKRCGPFISPDELRELARGRFVGKIAYLYDSFNYTIESVIEPAIEHFMKVSVPKIEAMASSSVINGFIRSKCLYFGENCWAENEVVGSVEYCMGFEQVTVLMLAFINHIDYDVMSPGLQRYLMESFSQYLGKYQKILSDHFEQYSYVRPLFDSKHPLKKKILRQALLDARIFPNIPPFYHSYYQTIGKIMVESGLVNYTPPPGIDFTPKKNDFDLFMEEMLAKGPELDNEPVKPGGFVELVNQMRKEKEEAKSALEV